jgi:hypothetical protein
MIEVRQDGLATRCFGCIFAQFANGVGRPKGAASHEHGMAGAGHFDDVPGVFNTTHSSKVIP